MATKLKPATKIIAVDPNDILLLDCFERRQETRTKDTDTYRSLVAECKANGGPDTPPIGAYTDEDGVPNPKGKVACVAGATRVNACIDAGLESIDIKIIEAASKADLLRVGARENLVRNELSKFEIGDIIREFEAAGMTQRQIGAELGLSDGAVVLYRDASRYADETVREAVAAGKAPMADFTKAAKRAKEAVAKLNDKRTDKGEVPLGPDAVAALVKEKAAKEVAKRVEQREKGEGPKHGGNRQDPLRKPLFGEFAGVEKLRTALEEILDALNGETQPANSAQLKDRAALLASFFAVETIDGAVADVQERRKLVKERAEKQRAAKEAKAAKAAAKKAAAAAKRDAAPRKDAPASK